MVACQQTPIDSTRPHKRQCNAGGIARWIVLHDPHTTQIAQSLMQSLTQSLTQAILIPQSSVSAAWGTFPDGMPKLFVNGQCEIGNRHVVLVVTLCDCSNAFMVAMMIRHLCECMPRSLTLVITACMFGTDDRADRKGMVVTCKHVFKIIEDAMSKASGVRRRVYVCEPHTLQMLSFYTGAIEHINAMTRMLQTVLEAHTAASSGPLCVVMPDNGADKRYTDTVRSFPGICKVVCNKEHVNTTVVVKIAENYINQDDRPTGYVIIDDMVRSGGTLIECYKAVQLLAGPDVPIDVAVVHADFVGNAIRNISGSGITSFYVTDSNPAVAATVQGVAPFKVLSIAPSIMDELKRVFEAED